MKVARSGLLILGTFGVLVVAGLFAFLIAWSLATVLFVWSRFSAQPVPFKSWTLAQFLVTFTIGVVVPYVLLLATAGF